MSNEYVYPTTGTITSPSGRPVEVYLGKGLTKRELFALHIYCSQDSKNTVGAVYWADQLLKELNK